MIFLRLLCLLAGVVILVVPPVMLSADGAVAPTLLLSMLLVSASFFYVGVAGHRVRRSPRLLRQSVALLVLPLLASAFTLWRSTDPAVLWLSGMLLGFTLVVGLVLAYPLLQGPSPRRLRARDTRRNRRLVLRTG
jgi:peptidoglycan/LPS O-acetylase OafA/YrhL